MKDSRIRLFIRGMLGLSLVVALEHRVAAAVEGVSLGNPSSPAAIGGNSDSFVAAISSDGGVVLMLSSANNLVTNDDHGKFVDVFLRNRTNATTTLVSVNASGIGGGNGHSISPALSANGRYVVFESEASNLVPNDTNNASDVFLRDLASGTTTLVSVNSAGTGGGNGPSTSSLISADGRFVIFASTASDLAANDTNRASDVFVRDLQTGTTTLMSVSANGVTSGNAASESPIMTPDGRWVVFESKANNLVAGATNSQGEIYARDRLTGTTYWASTNAAAIMASVNPQTHAMVSINPVVSADGRYVAFKTIGAAQLLLRHDLQTGSTDVVSTNAVGNTIGLDDASGPDMTPDGRFIAYTAKTGNDVSGYSAVYVWDAQVGASTLVSANLSGAIPSNTFSDTPAVSAEGRFVTFVSDASDLVTNAVDGSFQVYQRDVSSGTTRLVSADVNGGVYGDLGATIPAMSAEGRFVAFDNSDGDYVPNDFNNAYDVFVRDTATDTTELISPADTANQSVMANGFSSISANSLSADGRFIAFVSLADDLVATDANDFQDVFVRDMQTGTNYLVSINRSGTDSGNGFSGSPALSADGRFVAFVSGATNLTANDTNRNDDIYVRDLQNGTTTLVSVSTNGASGGSAASSSLLISGGGRYVVFFSTAKNLVPRDVTSGGEVFWRDLQNGTTVSVTPNGRASDPSMSADGRYVASFNGFVPVLTVWDSQIRSNIFSVSTAGPYLKSYTLSPDGHLLVYQAKTNLNYVLIAHDLAAGTDTIIGYSTVPGGTKTQISANGRFVTFVSAADAPNTTPGMNNVYLYDLQTATTTLVSFNRDRTGAGNGPSDSPSISADGRFVTFRSDASDLVANDANGKTDVFVFDRLTGSNTLISVNQSGTASANDLSSGPVISADGGTIAFRSLASDLVSGDFNETQDVFLSHNPVAAFVDSDGDGMDDAWERAYFVDLSHDGAGDSDGDGVSDLMEYKMGTNPMDADSKFSVQAKVEAGTHRITLSWEAVPGRSYRVEYTDDLGTAYWNRVPGGALVNGRQANCIDDTEGDSNQRFYRISLVD